MKRALSLFLSVLMMMSVLATFPATVMVSAEEVSSELTNHFTNQNKTSGYLKNGAVVNSAVYFVSDYIVASAGQNVYFGLINPKQDADIPVIACFDAEKQFLTDLYLSDITVDAVRPAEGLGSVQLPEGTGFIKVNVMSFYKDEFILTVGEEMTKADYYAFYNEEVPYIRFESPLFGKSAIFCGDSICSGYCESIHNSSAKLLSWGNRIGTYNLMSYKNKGIDGHLISSKTGNIIMNQFVNEPANYDFIIIEGGVNDAWFGADIGTITEGFDATLNTATFAGGLENTFKKAKEKHPDAIIGFIICFDTKNANVSSNYVDLIRNMSERWEVARQVCEKWEIPYLDLYDNAEVTSALHINDNQATKYLYDGVHPTTAGFEVLYPVIQSWMEELIEAKYPDGVPSTVIEDTTLTINPSRYGAMENWINSPNKGSENDVFQLLIEAKDQNGQLPAALLSTDVTWTLVISGSDGSVKNITIKPATTYSDYLTRFETVLQSREDQWIPKAGVSYTVEGYVIDKFGNFWHGTSSDGAFVCASSFVPTVPAEYDYQTVNPNAGITVGFPVMTIEIGEYGYCNVKFVPDFRDDDTTLTYTSDNEQVATVEDGKIYGVALGNCAVTVSNADGKYTGTINVTVTEKRLDPVNVALGKSVILGWNQTTSTKITDGVVGAYECYGIPKSYDVSTSTAYFELDLEYAYEIDNLKVVGHQWDHWYKWEAYATNDVSAPISEWTKLAEKTNEITSITDYEEDNRYYAQTDEKFRYLRVYGVDIDEESYHMIHLTEIEVYGEIGLLEDQLEIFSDLTATFNDSETDKLTDKNTVSDGLTLTIPNGVMTMDLGEVREIAYADFYNHYGNTAAFDLFGSVDGIEWTYLDTRMNADERNTGNNNCVPLTVNGSYRYLKITGRIDHGRQSFNDWAACVSEVEVFDPEGNKLTITGFKSANCAYASLSKITNGNYADDAWLGFPKIASAQYAIIQLSAPNTVRAIAVYASNGAIVQVSSNGITWTEYTTVSVSGTKYQNIGSDVRYIKILPNYADTIVYEVEVYVEKGTAVLPGLNADAGLTVDQSEVSISRSETAEIIAEFVPKYDTDPTDLIWTSDDESIATVKNGVITAVNLGTCTITVSNYDGEFTATVTVTVTMPATNPNAGFTVNSEKTTVKVGGVAFADVVFTPDYSWESKVLTWRSDNEAVAIVVGGRIKGIATGTCKITVTNADEKYSATFEVIVAPWTPDVTNIALGKEVLNGATGASITFLTDTVVDSTHAFVTIPKDYDVNTSTAYYQIDLGSSCSLDSLKVVGYQWDLWYKWEAYATNDADAPISDWVKITEKTNEVPSNTEYQNGTKYAVESNEGFRYIRIYGVDINEESYHMFHLCEIEVWGSVYSNESILAEIPGDASNVLTDGNTVSDGVTVSQGTGVIVVDMGEVKAISVAKVYNRYGNTAAYDLYGSVDGTAWVYLDSRLNNDSRNTGTSNCVAHEVNGSFRYLKVLGRADAGRTDYSGSFSEIEVYDVDDTKLTIQKATLTDCVYGSLAQLTNGNYEDNLWFGYPKTSKETSTIIDLGLEQSILALQAFADDKVVLYTSADGTTWTLFANADISGMKYFGNATARYIKVASGITGREVEVFEVKAYTEKTASIYDIDGDGDENIADVSLLLDCLAGNVDLDVDLDLDGQLTIADVTVLLDYLATK